MQLVLADKKLTKAINRPTTKTIETRVTSLINHCVWVLCGRPNRRGITGLARPSVRLFRAGC